MVFHTILHTLNDANDSAQGNLCTSEVMHLAIKCFLKETIRVLWVESCPPKIYILNSKPPVSQNVTLCGNRVFVDIIHGMRSYWILMGPQPSESIFRRETQDIERNSEDGVKLGKMGVTCVQAKECQLREASRMRRRHEEVILSQHIQKGPNS